MTVTEVIKAWVLTFRNSEHWEEYVKECKTVEQLDNIIDDFGLPERIDIKVLYKLISDFRYSIIHND